MRDALSRVALLSTARVMATTAELDAHAHASPRCQPATKALWLNANYVRVHALGGPPSARAELLACTDAAGMVTWWRTFAGIGEKYARNVMMDVYYPEFRGSIAVDAHETDSPRRPAGACAPRPTRSRPRATRHRCRQGS